MFLSPGGKSRFGIFVPVTRRLFTAAQRAIARVNIGMQDGQLPATLTNDNAAAGCVGEFKSSSGSPGLSNGVAANVCSLSLEAGDWEAWVVGTIQGGPGTFQTANMGVTTSSATIAPASQQNQLTFGAFTQMYVMPLNVSPVRFSLAVTTTIYCVAYATFNAGSATGNASLYARRRR